MNKHTFKEIFIFTVTAFFSISLTAQSPLKFEKLDIADAPFFAYTPCFYQDSRGFMWFGSLSGLSMFDGYTVTYFKNNPNDPLSISDNKISSMLEDGIGNLWVGTQNGLNYFDYKKQTFKHYNIKKEHGIGITGTNCIAIDVHKNIWVGTSDGLYWLDSTTQKFCLYTNQFSSIFTASIEFTDKGLYALTSAGLYFKAYNSSRFSLIDIPANKKGQKDFNLRTLFKDKNGVLWIGTSDGLFYIDVSKNNTLLVEQPFFKDELIHIFQQKNEEALWICTKMGLYHFNPRTF